LLYRRKLLPRMRGRWQAKRAGGGSSSAFGGEDAPSTMRRMVPLPRFAEEEPNAVSSEPRCGGRALGGREVEEPAGEGEMRLIDHLAVERQGAGIRVAGEGRDDPLRPFPFHGADRKGF